MSDENISFKFSLIKFKVITKMKNELIYNKLLEVEKLFRLNSDLTLDINGAAELLKIKKSYVYQLTSKFEIPYYKLGKKLLFSRLEQV